MKESLIINNLSNRQIRHLKKLSDIRLVLKNRQGTGRATARLVHFEIIPDYYHPSDIFKEIDVGVSEFIIKIIIINKLEIIVLYCFVFY